VVEVFVNKLLVSLLGFALGIAVEILFASFAKRLERKARSNAQYLRCVQSQIEFSAEK